MERTSNAVSHVGVSELEPEELGERSTEGQVGPGDHMGFCSPCWEALGRLR